jgi:hypothetical protein
LVLFKVPAYSHSSTKHTLQSRQAIKCIPCHDAAANEY